MLFLVLLISQLNAQESSKSDAAERKQAQAVRVSNGAIRVDGRLDDQGWGQAVPIIDFIQKEPNEGASPTEDMQVRIVYDDSAIYIGARMFNRQRVPIQAPLGRRDGIEGQAEYIMASNFST